MRRKRIYKPDEPKQCARCGAAIPNRRCYCEACNLDVKREYSHSRYTAKEYKPIRPCVICGMPTKTPQSTYCSEACRAEAERRREYDRHPHPMGYACGPVPGLKGWNTDELTKAKSTLTNPELCYDDDTGFHNQ